VPCFSILRKIRSLQVAVSVLSAVNSSCSTAPHVGHRECATPRLCAAHRPIVGVTHAVLWIILVLCCAALLTGGASMTEVAFSFCYAPPFAYIPIGRRLGNCMFQISSGFLSDNQFLDSWPISSTLSRRPRMENRIMSAARFASGQRLGRWARGGFPSFSFPALLSDPFDPKSSVRTHYFV
jgi:hypothetical protein